MNEEIQIFLKNIKERNHVLQLVDHIALELQFCCGFHKQGVVLINGEAFLSEKPLEAVPFYEIKGELEVIKKLLEGKEMLRSLIRKKQLTVSAPFRTILLLESVFYLMKSDEPLQKII